MRFTAGSFKKHQLPSTKHQRIIKRQAPIAEFGAFVFSTSTRLRPFSGNFTQGNLRTSNFGLCSATTSRLSKKLPHRESGAALLHGEAMPGISQGLSEATPPVSDVRCQRTLLRRLQR